MRNNNGINIELMLIQFDFDHQIDINSMSSPLSFLIGGWAEIIKIIKILIIYKGGS